MREQFSFIYCILIFFVCFEWLYLLCMVFASSLHLLFVLSPVKKKKKKNLVVITVDPLKNYGDYFSQF